MFSVLENNDGKQEWGLSAAFLVSTEQAGFSGKGNPDGLEG